jgi:hypothetical protein
MSRFIAMTRDKVLEVHALDPFGATDTLCGCDSNDDHADVGTHPASLPDYPKITCSQCVTIIKFCRRYKDADFSRKLSI